MSKHGTFGDYPPGSLWSAEAALLTVWQSLERYHDDLALIGGLAVHYLTRSDAGHLPGAVTMDVDFGISLAASGDQYGTLRSDLAGLGFRSVDNRLVRTRDGINLYLDFLTEDPPAIKGSRMVDDVVASVIPGVNRALACRRMINVKGRDLFENEQMCQVAVADVGPLLVLKLNAFGGPTGRRLPKDAYDVLLAVTGYLDGPEAAVAAFHAEAQSGNTGHASAVETLRRDFIDPGKDGPVRAAAFYAANAEAGNRIRQDAVTVAQMLLGNTAGQIPE
ncbi:hypothetical protein OpiT1DRAFT_03771 [Opitutaceae bacterium TAV1]|nr:hypothetical protein OpiT1DRAFT_03771 [Opitutaceae bacterium TAV1]